MMEGEDPGREAPGERDQKLENLGERFEMKREEADPGARKSSSWWG